MGLCAQTQPVGHGDDGPVSHRAEGRTQQRDAGGVRLDGGHFLRGGLAGGQVEISGGVGLFLPGGGVLPPVGEGGVVVGTRVDHAVLDVVVGQILVVAAAESELQNFHAREGAVGQQLADAGEQLAQIFRDDGQLAKGSFQCVEQVHPGADLPLAGAGGRAARRDGPVGVETAEVVDAEQVVDAEGVADTPDPPGVSRLFMIRPVIQRVSPELAVCGEVIRRTAGHAGKASLRVQLEELAAHPCIHRVGRDVDRDVAENFHALFVGVVLDLFPLGGKLVLQELPEADLLFLLCCELCQRGGVPQAVVPGPLSPALHAVGGLEGHVEGVIIQPAVVGKGESVVVVGVVVGAAVEAGVLLAPCGVGGAQHFIAAGVESAVVHRKRVIAPLFRLELGGGQQAVGLESVEVDEVGVARKGRAALVGAVAVAGGAEGQQLPDVLARSGQKIHELERFGAKAANTIGAGQAGHRHQDSTFTHDDTFLALYSVWVSAVSYHNISEDYFPQAKNVVYLVL